MSPSLSSSACSAATPRSQLRDVYMRDHVSDLSDDNVRRVTEILTGLTIPANVVTP